MRRVQPYGFLALAALVMVPAALWGQEDAAKSPTEVASLLDRVIAPRFQIDAGVFGVSRVVDRMSGHDSVRPADTSPFAGTLTPQGDEESRLIKRANRYQHDYMIAFLHCAHVPGTPKGAGVLAVGLGPDRAKASARQSAQLSGLFRLLAVRDKHSQLVYREPQMVAGPTGGFPGKTAADKNQKTVDLIEKSALGHLEDVKKGAAAQFTRGDWYVLMEPVKASKAECISCHTGAKKNDTLGIMIYAVNTLPAGQSHSTARR